jgi:hypothetical protein
VNSNEKCAEYMSLFIDDHLKKGLKGVSDLFLSCNLIANNASKENGCRSRCHFGEDHYCFPILDREGCL